MLFALVHLVLRRLLGFAAGSESKDVEILVLRHQLKVLRRQGGQPRLRRLDRMVLAAASRALPRPAWARPDPGADRPQDLRGLRGPGAEHRGDPGEAQHREGCIYWVTPCDQRVLPPFKDAGPTTTEPSPV